MDAATPKVLLYTLAFDALGSTLHREQAHMLVCSLLRTGFAGNIKIIHNGETEIFSHPRRGVEEIGVDYPEGEFGCYYAKFLARKFLPAEGYDWVLFLDCDVLVTSSLDGWFQSERSILYATEPTLPIQSAQFNGYLTDDEMAGLNCPGINSGTFLIRAAIFSDVMEQWEHLAEMPLLRPRFGKDQLSWNRLILDTPHSAGEFTGPEITMFYSQRDFLSLLRTPVIHFCGLSSAEKTVLMRALFLTCFHAAEDGRLIEMLER